MSADAVVEAVGAAVSSVLVWLLLRFVLADASRAPASDGQRVVFRHGRSLAFIGWGTLGVGVAMVGGAAAAFPVWTRGEVYGAIVFFGLFALGSLYFLASHRREYVALTADGIEGRGAFGRRPVFVLWEDVAAVRFGRVSGLLTVHSADGRRVRVSAVLSGVADLAALVEQQLALEGGAAAAEALRTFRRNLA
jgi:hypothetical protein